MIGKVRWFNPAWGYGFITSGKTDYFVFYKAIKMKGFRKLEPGKKVSFKIKVYQGHKQANQVKQYK